MVNFSVYRTYINQDKITPTDELYIEQAIEGARKEMPGLTNELSFIKKFFFINPAHLSEERRREYRDFALKLQQYTGPLMAKGFEDTVLYVYNKLISLNEVGGDPQHFGVALKDFHSFNQQRLKKTPFTLNATSTHDTKRGEDVRARINVLSEFPSDWKKSARYWNRINQIHRTFDGDRVMPDENDEYALYQTMIGSLPANRDMETWRGRLRAWMIKAVREAKVHTEWIKPDGRYEEACVKFIEGILQPGENNLFLPDFQRFQKRVSFYGTFNSLSQTLLKLTSPGVPDIYQGSELWDLSLVDPDNRRPVDFGIRKAMLKDLIARSQPDTVGDLMTELLHMREDGRIKMFLIYQALKARKANAPLFQKGSYRPLRSSGSHKEKIVAFSRKKDAVQCVAIIPRFLSGLIKEDTLPLGPEVWQDTSVTLPNSPKSWTNIITGERIKGETRLLIGDAFRRFPVALLISE